MEQLCASQEQCAGDAWIRDHLANDLSLTALARRAGMSERSLGRNYAKATGSTPRKPVERLRVEAASRQLAEALLPMKRITVRCDFPSEESMRRSFLRFLHATSTGY
jgi:transcriptional regulator GlxA family with amidase domain